MSNTHVYGIFGGTHVRGSAAGEAESNQPIVMGPTEQLLRFDGVHGLSLNDTIEQSVLGGVFPLRARVVDVTTDYTAIVEPMQGDGDVSVTLLTSVYPAALDGERRAMWKSEATITKNGGAYTPKIQAYTNSQFIEQLNDPELEAVTDDSVFWDPAAQLARVVTVSGFVAAPNEYIFIGDRLSSVENGGSFLVVGLGDVDAGAGTATLYVAGFSGTVNDADTLSSDHTGVTLSGVTVVDNGTAQTVGAWVPYCPSPALGVTIEDLANENGNAMFGSTWEVPPRGNGQGKTALLGPDVKIVPNAVAAHSGADDVDDQGARVMLFASSDATGNGVLAGVSIQKVPISGASGTFTVGEVISSSGTWSAKVASHDGSDLLYVYDTNGETLANTETVTGATSTETATATGAAIGWQKGSSHWNELAAEITAATTADGYLHNSSAAEWERVFLMIWEGEMTPYSALGETLGASLLLYLGLNPDVYPRQWLTFVTDLRTLLGNDDMPVRVWMNHSGAQSDGIVGTGFVTTAIRNAMTALPETVAGLSIVDSLKRGHIMQEATLQSDGSDGGDAEFYLRTMDYVDLGTALWNGSANRTITAPIGNLQILPVGVIAGSQSQMDGTTKYNTDVGGVGGLGVAYIDKDPELWTSASFVDMSGSVKDTTDANGLIWNFDEEELEVYDVNLNDNTFHRALSDPYGTSGPTVPIMQRQKMRYGNGTSSGLFAIFKGSLGASCMNPDVRYASGCWQPNMAARPTLSTEVTVTHSGSNAIFTATTPGVFEPYIGDGTDYTVIITEGAGVQGAGGRNTVVKSFQSAKNIDADSFEISDEFGTIADGTETLRFTWGPPPLFAEFSDQWKKFTIRCIELGYYPRPVWLLQDQGESDFTKASEYKQYLDEFWTGFIDLCGYREGTSDSDITKAIVQVHQYSPLATDPTQISGIRGLQATKASTLTNCVLIDPSTLPLEDVRPAAEPMVTVDPPYPRRYRVDNGTHLTAIGMITKGYMIDAALGGVSLVADHPNAADISVGYGASNGTGKLEETA